MSDERVTAWLEALDARHLANLTPSEAGRALRALSSCYVERRSRLAGGGALDSAGKRAAFALFYAPLHFIVVDQVVRALPGCAGGLTHVLDLGCGTGGAGAAWALASDRASVEGIDRNPWAVAEANWTYQQLRLRGRAARGDAAGTALKAAHGTGILAAYAVNELSEEARGSLLTRLLHAHRTGARVLIVEPIARKAMSWLSEWERVVLPAGGRMDEWRFPSSLPPRQKGLAKSAGLDPRELTARTLYLPPHA